jgi:hypothetical protein
MVDGRGGCATARGARRHRVGDWRLREEEYGRDGGDEDLGCGGRRVSFVGCYWANVLSFSWATIHIRYCSVNSVY